MNPPPVWTQRTLQAAAVYNVAWGIWVILFPSHLFQWTGIEPPNYPGIWQCVGMIVGVYGVGYWFAARDCRIHWPVVLVGFLGKLFGPIGFLQSAISGALPWSWGVTILTNDLVWWVPFAGMLYLAFKHHNDPLQRFRTEGSGANSSMPAPVLSNGTSIDSFLSQSPSLLLVFLRHAGCTFCRETLADLAKEKLDLESKGHEIAIVHMSPLEDGARMLSDYGLQDLVHISDPGCSLYRQFNFQRGKLSQLFGPEVWWKGFQAAILKRHGLGKLSGDGFQLGGWVLLNHGKLVRAFPAKNASTTIPNSAMLTDSSSCPI